MTKWYDEVRAQDIGDIFIRVNYSYDISTYEMMHKKDLASITTISFK